MAVQDTEQGSSRTAYKVVALVTLWVDDGERHDVLVETAKQIITKEIYHHLDGAGYKLGDADMGFVTAVEAVEIIKRQDLH